MSEKPQPKLSIVPRLADTEAAQTVVKALEIMLERAKSGDLVGVSIVGYDKSRCVCGNFVTGENPTLLLGALTNQVYSLNKIIGDD